MRCGAALLLCLAGPAATTPAAVELKDVEATSGSSGQPLLTLDELSSMWRTGVATELDAAHNFESAWQDLLDVERRALQAEEGSSVAKAEAAHGKRPKVLRSPYLLCTDRDPYAIAAAQEVVQPQRTRLFYSRGERLCLVVHTHAEEAKTLAELHTTHLIEPLPPAAKVAPTLVPPSSAIGSGRWHRRHGRGRRHRRRSRRALSGDSAIAENKAAAAEEGDEEEVEKQPVLQWAGHELPEALAISLSPGVWGYGLGASWAAELANATASVDTAGGAWASGLAKRLPWTSREHGRRLALTHGLSRRRRLWDQVRRRAAAPGACDYSKLWMEGNEGPTVSRGERGKHQSHDTVVLRGTDKLGGSGGGSGGGSDKDSDSLSPAAAAHTECLLSLVAWLSVRPDVTFIDELPRVSTSNKEAAWIVQSGVRETYSVWDEGVLGSGQIVAVADSGLDQDSCYFRDASAGNIECSSYYSPVYDLSKRKVVQYVGYVDCFDYEHGHGSHVSGTVGGAIADQTAGWHLGDGVAHSGKIAFFDFGGSTGGLITPSDLYNMMLQPPYDIGARISTNSWGATTATYTILDSRMDQFAYDQSDMTILVANGNCGDSRSGCADTNDGSALYGAGSTLSPAGAKNIISVGASMASSSTDNTARSIDDVAYFSSQGPTADGRIKPDVVAPGYYLFSADAQSASVDTCAVGAMAGTSMATPVVAGSAALIREYFIEGWYPSGLPNPSDIRNPSNALVKAMLVTSAVDMANYAGQTTVPLTTAPDGYQGFGRPQLNAALNFYDSVSLVVVEKDSIEDGEIMWFEVDLSAHNSGAYTGSVKATLVFMEAGAPSSSTAPVFNDLDLLVEAYDGSTWTTFYPNNGVAADTINTVERVVIDNPDDYTLLNISVTGTSVTTGPYYLPYYAVVVTGGVASSYDAGSSLKAEWRVVWRMLLTGPSTAEAATAAFGTSMAQALATETGGNAAVNSTLVVSVMGAASGAGGDVYVTVEIDVGTKSSVGDAIMTYILSVQDDENGARASLAATLSDELASRTTSGCLCVVSQAGSSGGDSNFTSYDCDTCTDGAAFSSVTDVSTEEGDFSLVSSAVDSSSSTGDDDGAKIEVDFVDSVLRTNTQFYLYGIIVAIVAFTGVIGLGIMVHYQRSRPNAAAAPAGAKKGAYMRVARPSAATVGARGGGAGGGGKVAGHGGGSGSSSGGRGGGGGRGREGGG